ncbi:hypothetical protein E2C01_073741 [Portunus trituberculatus]|uniref:Uncharacterized protein n=1 Tax=Portunus trituberculatus TaxID=210409 RepID=A0A5B7IAI6_PORTR|nr:hypothetical protein [Portunus trituberculatus]
MYIFKYPVLESMKLQLINSETGFPESLSEPPLDYQTSHSPTSRSLHQFKTCSEALSTTRNTRVAWPSVWVSGTRSHLRCQN